MIRNGMSDQELIELVQTQLPADLTPPQIELLRKAMRSSPDVREALLDELRLETGLATRLAPEKLAAEEFVEKIEKLVSIRRRSRFLWFSLFLVLGFGMIAGGAGIAISLSQDDDDRVAVNDDEPEKKEAAKEGDDGKTKHGGKVTDGSATVTGKGDDIADQGEGDTTKVVDAGGDGPDITELPLDPPWRLYDDPAAHGDRRWMGRADQILTPIRHGRMDVDQNEGYYRLSGAFKLVPPDNDGRTVRLRLDELKEMTVDAWSGDQGARIEWDVQRRRLRGFTMRRPPKGEPGHGLPGDVNPVFLRESMLPRVDRTIDFNWAGGAPGDGVPPDDFAVRWAGKLRVPRDGRYRFIATTDDGVALYLDGKRIIHDWINRSVAESTAELDLTAGDHDLVLEYFESNGDAAAKLEWEGPEIKRQIIPTDALRTERGEPGLTGLYCFGRQRQVDQPTDVSVVSDDGGVWRLLREGAVDLRYQAGHVVLARGDVVLLAIPLGSAPTETILHTNSRLWLVDLLRLEPLALNARATDLPAADVKAAGDVTWQIHPQDRVAELTVDRAGDGTVTFTRDPEKDTEIYAALELPEQGGVEVVFELPRIASHTGVFFTDPSRDNGVRRLLFAERGGKFIPTWNPNDGGDVERWRARGFLFNDRVWARVTFGVEHQAFDLSNDGRHWMRVDENHYEDANTLASTVRVGVGGMHGKGERSIEVANVSVRRLDVLSPLAPAELRPQAIAHRDSIERNPTWNAMLERLADAKPDGATESEWTRAFALAKLTGPAKPGVREQAIIDLVELAIDDGVDADHVTAALALLPRMTSFLSDRNRSLHWEKLASLYDRLAMRLWTTGDRQAVVKLLHQWYAQSFGINSQWRDHFEHVAPPVLSRLVMFHHWANADWRATRLAAMRFSYLSQYGNPWRGENAPDEDVYELSEWMTTLANRELPDGPDDVEVGNRRGRRGRGRLRYEPHPLAVDTDRDAHNTVAEFLAAVDDKAYDHALAILTGDALPEGITPVNMDGELFKASHVLLRQTLDNHEELAAKLKADYERLGLVRLQQALRAGRIDVLESMATQFHGTEAARQALKHLADRDLSMGNVFSAAARYETLIAQMIDPADKAEMTAKRRLALAMTGQNEGEPATGPVELGGRQMQADEFEQLISSLIEQRRKAAMNVASPNRRLLAAPAPAAMKLSLLHDLNEPRDIRDPGQRIRQFGWAIDGHRLLLHQHSRLMLIDLRDGRVIWKQEDRARDLPSSIGAPASPFIAGDRAYVPFFRDRRMELTCFDLNNGEVKWRQHYGDGIIGDAIMVGPWMYVITISRQLGDYADVTLRRVSPQTGESVLARRIVRMRYGEPLYRVGRPALFGDTLMFRTGNALICTDLLGATRWIRRLPYVPPEVDPALFDFQRPRDLILVGDHVIVNTPGSPFVTCLDARTGDQVWSYLQPRLRKLVGAVGDRVILSSVRHVQALNLATGEPVWQRPLRGDYEAVMPAAGNTLLALTLDKIDRPHDVRKGAVRQAQWLNAADGSVIATVEVDEHQGDLYDAERLLSDGEVVIALCSVVSRNNKPDAKLALLTPAGAPRADADANEASPAHTPLPDAKLKWGPWHVAGPFNADGYPQAYKQEFEPEKKVDLDATYQDGKIRWEKRENFTDGEIHELQGEDCATYLYRTVEAEAAGTAELSLGSDDSIKVWVNGKQVLAHHVGRGVAPDQERIIIDLKQGKNEVLMKIVNGPEDYAFYFKVR